MKAPLGMIIARHGWNGMEASRNTTGITSVTVAITQFFPLQKDLRGERTPFAIAIYL